MDGGRRAEGRGRRGQGRRFGRRTGGERSGGEVAGSGGGDGAVRAGEARGLGAGSGEAESGGREGREAGGGRAGGSEGKGSPSDLEAREWLYHRSNEEWFDNHLTGRDIDWIMGRENNENLLLRRTPATNRHRELWDIETGNYVTLGEFFRFGADWLSCFDLYRMYLTFPPFISKRNHSR